MYFPIIQMLHTITNKCRTSRISEYYSIALILFCFFNLQKFLKVMCNILTFQSKQYGWPNGTWTYATKISTIQTATPDAKSNGWHFFLNESKVKFCIVFCPFNHILFLHYNRCTHRPHHHLDKTHQGQTIVVQDSLETPRNGHPHHNLNPSLSTTFNTGQEVRKNQSLHDTLYREPHPHTIMGNIPPPHLPILF